MSLLFDASAIINLSHSNKPEVFMSGRTVSLAEYEIGNAVWKRVRLTEELSEIDGARVLRRISESIALMDIVSIRRVEDVLRLACEEDLPYYDAYYIAAAKASGSALVTDDKTLRRKALKYTEALGSVDL